MDLIDEVARLVDPVAFGPDGSGWRVTMARDIARTMIAEIRILDGSSEDHVRLRTAARLDRSAFFDEFWIDERAAYERAERRKNALATAAQIVAKVRHGA